MKVIIVAYACLPESGSEEGVGYNTIESISKFAYCKVITNSANKKILNKSKINNVEWIYLDEIKIKKKSKFFWNFLETSIFRPFISIPYYFWQKNAELLANKMCQIEKIDIVHRLTYVGYRYPFKIENKKIPLIIGPVGGTENMSYEYLKLLDLKAALYFFIRNMINLFQLKFYYKLKKNYREKNCYIISAHSKISKDMHKYFNKNSYTLSEICLQKDLENINIIKSKSINHKNLQLIWVGNMEYGKNLLPLIYAMKKIQQNSLNINLNIIGTGSYKYKYKKIIQKFKLGNIKVIDKIPNLDVINKMIKSHVFINTSLKDLTSTVLVEAMYTGCAIICTPLSGFKDALEDEGCFYIDTKNKRLFIESIYKNIKKIYFDRNLILQMGNKNIKNSKKFYSTNKSEIYKQLYNKIINNHHHE